MRSNVLVVCAVVLILSLELARKSGSVPAEDKRLVKRALKKKGKGGVNGCAHRFRFRCLKKKKANVPSHQKVGQDRTDSKIRKLKKLLRMFKL